MPLTKITAARTYDCRVSNEAFEQMKNMMSLYPQPERPGVDLLWHMDRAIDYMLNDMDDRQSGLPFSANRIYLGPARLRHDNFDLPHNTGRFLLALLMWEESVGKKISNAQTVDQLKLLMHNCFYDKDGLAHTPGVDQTDMHSQREALVALTDLSKVRNDQKSADLAKELIQGVARKASDPVYRDNPMEGGRIIHALLNHHRLTGEKSSLDLVHLFAEKHLLAFKKSGTATAHLHSYLGTLVGLLDYGIYTKQSNYIDYVKHAIDTVLPEFRSSYGFVLESAGKGGRGEANNPADIVRLEIMLGSLGYTDYYGDAERMIRNHLLASQFLDPTITMVDALDENNVDNSSMV